MTADEFVARFALAAGIQAPTPDEVAGLLALAAEAAHASERTAAPVTCWVAARAGLTIDEAVDLARRLTM